MNGPNELDVGMYSIKTTKKSRSFHQYELLWHVW